MDTSVRPILRRQVVHGQIEQVIRQRRVLTAELKLEAVREWRSGVA